MPVLVPVPVPRHATKVWSWQKERWRHWTRHPCLGWAQRTWRRTQASIRCRATAWTRRCRWCPGRASLDGWAAARHLMRGAAPQAHAQESVGV